MAGNFYQDLIEKVKVSANQSNTELTKAAGEITGIANKQETAFDQSNATMQGAIASAAVLAGKKAEVDYKQNVQLEAAQRLFGLDPESANYAIAREMNRYETAKTARESVRSEYDQLNQVGFLDNPLGWIFAQAQLPQVAAQNNALASTEDAALQDIQARQAAFAARKSTLVANTADMVKATQLEEAQLKATVAGAELQEHHAKNLSVIASTRLQAAQLIDKRGDNTRSALGQIATLESQEQNRQHQLRMEAAQAPAKKYNELLLEQKYKEIKDSATQEAHENERLKVISDIMKLPIPMTVDRMKLLGQKEKAYWNDAIYSSGLGTLIGDSTRFYLTKNNDKGKENASLVDMAEKLNANISKYENRARAKLTPPPGTPGQNPTAEQVRDSASNMYSQDQIRAMTKKDAADDLSSPLWNPDGTYNVYVAPFAAFNHAINTNAQFAPLKDNLVKKQFDTLAAAGTLQGGTPTSDQQKQAFAAIENMVIRGTISPQKAAADIQQYITTAVGYNRLVNKYELMGLPEQDKYLFTLPGGKRVDLMNGAELENEVTRQATEERKRRMNLTPGRGGIGIYNPLSSSSAQ